MATQQSATVVVVNGMSKTTISGVFVSHKYSNVYKNNEFVGQLNPNQQSAPFTVQYNTGFATTGNDWWLVGFQLPDGRQYCSLPESGIAILNFLEKGAVNYGGALVGAIAATLATPVTGAVAAVVVNPFIKALMNSEDVTAYKRHTLTSADAGKTVIIKILDNNKIEIQATSSTSKNTYDRACKNARIVVRNETGQQIDGGFVWHKYGDVYKDQEIFEKLEPLDPKKPSNRSTSAEFKVNYNTGGISRDWWLIGFRMGGKTYVTSPNNLQGLLDFLKGSTPYASAIASSILAVTSVAGNFTDVLAQMIDGSLQTIISDSSNSGYKQHNLSASDEDQITTIVIKSDGNVYWQSTSGSSSTGYAEVPASALPAPVNRIANVNLVSMLAPAPVRLSALPPHPDSGTNVQALYTCYFSCDNGRVKILLSQRNERSYWNPCPVSTTGANIVKCSAEMKYNFAIYENGTDVAYGKSRKALIGGLYDGHDNSTGPQQIRALSEFNLQTGLQPPKGKQRYLIVSDSANNSCVGVLYIQLDENSLSSMTKKIAGNIVEAKDIIAFAKGNFSNFSHAFASKPPPVYSTIIGSVKIYDVNEAIAILPHDGHSKSVLQTLRDRVVPDMVHLENTVNQAALDTLSTGFNYKRSTRFTERKGSSVTPAGNGAAVPISLRAAPAMKLSASAPAALGAADAPESLDDILNNSDKGATTISAVPQVPDTTTPHTDPTTPPPTKVDTSYIKQLSSLMKFNTFVSVYRGATLLKNRPQQYNIADPRDAGQMVIDIANTTNDLYTRYLTKYFTIDTVSNRTFSKSATSADLHVEFLDDLFKPFGFDSETTKELDGVLTSIVDSLKGLSISFSDQSQSLNHFVSMMYFEKVEGLDGPKVPKMRTFFIHIDQGSWTSVVGTPKGSASFSHVQFNMNYVESTGLFDAEQFDADYPNLKTYMEKVSGHTMDQLNQSVAKVDAVKDSRQS